MRSIRRSLAGIAAGIVVAATALQAQMPAKIDGRDYRLYVPRPTDLTVSGKPGSPEFTFVLRPGAHIPNEKVRERSEISFYDHLYQGDIVDQDYLVEADGVPTVEPGVIIGQWHGAASSGLGPWLELSITNQQYLQLRVQSTSRGREGLTRAILYKRVFEQGKWYDVHLRLRPGPEGVGFVDAWIDAEPVAHYRGPLGYLNEKNFGFFKFGAYRWVPGKMQILVRYKSVHLEINRSAETCITQKQRLKSSRSREMLDGAKADEYLCREPLIDK